MSYSSTMKLLSSCIRNVRGDIYKAPTMCMPSHLSLGYSWVNRDTDRVSHLPTSHSKEEMRNHTDMSPRERTEILLLLSLASPYSISPGHFPDWHWSYSGTFAFTLISRCRKELSVHPITLSHTVRGTSSPRMKFFLWLGSLITCASMYDDNFQNKTAFPFSQWEDPQQFFPTPTQDLVNPTK